MTGGNTKAGAKYDAQDVVRALQRAFGTRYEESYEHGKHLFRDALAKDLGLSQSEAMTIVEDLEQSMTIRFKSAGEASTADADGPRVGLFDEPGPPRERGGEPDAGGRYWVIGDDEDLDAPRVT
jgi:hypothetical protein